LRDIIIIMIRVIPREAKRITYSSEIRKLKTVPFAPEQLSIVNGALLGDGCLHTAWAGTSKNYRFAKTHSIKQKEYVDWTYKKLQPFVLSRPWLYKPVQSLKLRTISHPELTILRDRYYPNGKKILPDNIEAIIKDPLSLAVWFMDDGNSMTAHGVTHGYHINTQSFSRKENERLVTLFLKTRGLHCTLQKNNGRVRIYIRSRSKYKFANIVYEHMIPSMQYKLG
jgi:hypothetical protein